MALIATSATPDTPPEVLNLRRAWAQRRFQVIDWYERGLSVGAFIECPHADGHTTATRRQDTIVYLKGGVHIRCLHASCRDQLDALTPVIRHEVEQLETEAGIVPQPVTTDQQAARQQLDRQEQSDEAMRRAAAAALPAIVERYRIDVASFIKTSPAPIAPVPAEHFRQHLSLFQPGDIIWLGTETDSCGDDADDNRKRVCSRHFRSVANWLTDAHVAPFPFTTVSIFNAGAYHRGSTTIADTPYFVLESDKLTEVEALAVIRWLQNFLNLRAVLHSGGKSIHAWTDAPTDEQLRELEIVLPALGMDVKMFNQAQPCRVAGYLRRHDDGRQVWQRLYWLNTEKSTAASSSLPSQWLNGNVTGGAGTVTTVTTGMTDATEAKRQRVGKIWTARELYDAELPPVRWLVEEVFPQGLILLCSAPKIGKTILTIRLAIEIARGGRAFDKIPVEQGEIFILSLENSANELQELLSKMLAEGEATDLIKIRTLTEGWLNFGTGGLEMLVDYLDLNPGTRAVVIDTWQRVKPAAKKNLNAYESDTAILGPLQQLAKQRGISIILIHHLRKEPSPADVFAEISGSVGSFAVVDCAAVIKRQRMESTATLHLTGRFAAERSLAMQYDQTTLTWVYLGDAAEFAGNEKKQAILDVLREAGVPMSPQEIYDRLRVKNPAGVMPKNTVKSYLLRMSKQSPPFVISVGKGRYALPDPTMPTGAHLGSAAGNVTVKDEQTSAPAAPAESNILQSGNFDGRNNLNPSAPVAPGAPATGTTGASGCNVNAPAEPSAEQGLNGNGCNGCMDKPVAPPTLACNDDCMCWLELPDGEHHANCHNKKEKS